MHIRATKFSIYVNSVHIWLTFFHSILPLRYVENTSPRINENLVTVCHRVHVVLRIKRNLFLERYLYVDERNKQYLTSTARSSDKRGLQIVLVFWKGRKRRKHTPFDKGEGSYICASV